MDKSDFVPGACSTANRKKNEKRQPPSIQSYFEEEGLFPTGNSSIQRENSLSEASYQLEEQRRLARTSLQRVTKVSGIPSKYFRANLTKTESQTEIYNDSTINESDLLHTPKTSSTPRTSLSLALAQFSNKATDSNVSIDNLVSNFKNVLRQADEQSCSLFRPSEEAASMLLADELSWRQKNEIPVQEKQFSVLNYTGTESIGSFFQKGSNTLSDFPGGMSPNVTREPIALIEPSFSLVERNVSQEENEKKSLSISAIQKFLASEDTPRRTVNNLCKFAAESEKMGSLENRQSFSLPVSKNSSYNSDHSENEAMKLICNRENINSLNTNTKNSSNSSSPSSRTSSRASSALTSLPNGKLPIETSKCDLIWGCVKLGKSVTQEFMIRNKSSKRLGLQLTLCSQEFKLKGNLSSNKIILHPHESKAVTVTFIPTKIGAAIDELHFTSFDSNLNQRKKQCIRLFGYGGSLKVNFRNLTRDTTGKFWLPLGKLDDRAIKKSQFYVKNKGDVTVFIHISINSLDTSKLVVTPHFFTLSPQEEREIEVSYKPSYEIYNESLHTTTVIDLGSLNIIFGAEVERGRIRKLCEKCIENGLKIPPVANTLITERVEGENMPVDLAKFNEPPNHLQEIINLLTHNQIILTLERDPEQTIIRQYSDDSGLYQSLYQDTTVIGNQSETHHSCLVAPTIIMLTIPFKRKDTIYLQSNNQNRLNFIASCQQNDLELKPREGILDSYSSANISVKYISTSSVTQKKNFKVVIIVENEIFEVDVKVEFLEFVKNKKSVLNCMI